MYLINSYYVLNNFFFIRLGYKNNTFWMKINYTIIELFNSFFSLKYDNEINVLWFNSKKLGLINSIIHKQKIDTGSKLYRSLEKSFFHKQKCLEHKSIYKLKSATREIGVWSTNTEELPVGTKLRLTPKKGR